MKIQIIRLEEFDNLFSLKEKITNAKAARVIISETQGSSILQDKKSAKLVKRSAQKSGKEIAIVTQDPDEIATLRGLRINNFPDLISAQQNRWEYLNEEDRHNFPASHPRAHFIHPVEKARSIHTWSRYLSFSSGIFAVIILALIFIPGAEIRINVPTRVQQIQIPAVFVERQESGQNKPLILQPESIETEAFQTIKVTGTKLVPYEKAQGEVEFANLTPDSVQIPEGLILVSSKDLNKEYITLAAGELKGGAAARLTIPVRAILPGIIGNAEPGEVSTVLGSMGLLVSVINPEMITGGTDVEQPYPSTEDKNQLREMTADELKRSALEEIQKGLKEDVILIPQSLEISELISEEYFPTTFSSTGDLSLTMKAKVTLFTVSKEQITAFSKPYLDALLPGEYSGDAEIEITDFQVEQVNSDGSVKTLITVKRITKRVIDPLEVTKLISGKPVTEATEQTLPSVSTSNAPLDHRASSLVELLAFLTVPDQCLIGGIICESLRLTQEKKE